MKRMGDLFALFESNAADTTQAAFERMANLLEAVRCLRVEQAKSCPPSFNLLSMAGLSADERQHSSILAWLLDETESHGNGSMFLQGFAKLCGLNFESEPSGYMVRREFSGSEAIADVVVFRQGDFVIYIENKVRAPLGKDQLGRERRDLRRFAKSLQVPKDRVVAVFLTLNGNPAADGSSNGWHHCSYPMLGKMLHSFPETKVDGKLKLFVQDWLELLKNL